MEEEKKGISEQEEQELDTFNDALADLVRPAVIRERVFEKIHQQRLVTRVIPAHDKKEREQVSDKRTDRTPSLRPQSSWIEKAIEIARGFLTPQPWIAGIAIAGVTLFFLHSSIIPSLKGFDEKLSSLQGLNSQMKGSSESLEIIGKNITALETKFASLEQKVTFSSENLERVSEEVRKISALGEAGKREKIQNISDPAEDSTLKSTMLNETVYAYVKAWNSKDPESISSIFAPEAVRIGTTGDPREGRGDLRKEYQDRFTKGIFINEKNYTNSSYEIEDKSLKEIFVSQDQAIADFQAKLSGIETDTGKKEVGTVRLVMFLTKGPEKWLIRSIHPSRISTELDKSASSKIPTPKKGEEKRNG